MSTYDFQCADCSAIAEEPVIFEHVCAMSTYTGQAICPYCDVVSTHRVYGVPAIHILGGLTASEKAAGTSVHRKDLGRFMKEQRTKRQREAEPGTRAHDSNELWTGSLPDGIKAPGK